MGKTISKSVSKAHRGAHKNYIKRRNLVQPGSSAAEQDKPGFVGWPDDDGLLVYPGRPHPKQDRKPRLTKPVIKKPKCDDDYWRELKSLDASAFNAGAEAFFVSWLVGKIGKADFQMVSVAWVISNAAFELDISPETVKRYVVKHTADAAEFRADKGFLTVREKEG